MVVPTHWRILLLLLFSFEPDLVGIYRIYFLEQKVVGWDMINGCGFHIVFLQYCVMQMVALAIHTRIAQTDATGKLTDSWGHLLVCVASWVFWWSPCEVQFPY